MQNIISAISQLVLFVMIAMLDNSHAKKIINQIESNTYKWYIFLYPHVLYGYCVYMTFGYSIDADKHGKKFNYILFTTLLVLLTLVIPLLSIIGFLMFLGYLLGLLIIAILM